MLLKKLLAPYPAVGHKSSRYILPFLAGFFVSLFLWLFEPFQMSELPKDERALQSLAYGAVTVVVVLFNVGFLPDFFPVVFKSKTWTVLSEILFEIYNLVCITIGNTLMHAYLMKQPFRLEVLMAFVVPTFSVGFFPVVFYVLYRQIVLERANIAISADIQPLVVHHHKNERELKATTHVANFNNQVTLSSDDGREEFTLPIQDILYLESAANYVELVYWSVLSEKPKKMLFRNTMKNIEGMLGNYPAVFLRCHRSFIVNIEQIKQVKGNSQGVNLWLGEGIDYVPVSRTNIPKLKELLGEGSAVN